MARYPTYNEMLIDALQKMELHWGTFDTEEMDDDYIADFMDLVSTLVEVAKRPDELEGLHEMLLRYDAELQVSVETGVRE